MAFITDDLLTEATQAANAMRAEPLPDHWERIIPTANRRAYYKLRGVMLGRGFSAAQFASWGNGETTDGADWNKRLGVVYAFLEASKGDDDRGREYRAELKELFEELKILDIVIDGDIAVPASGRVGFGDAATSSDRFLLNDPEGDGLFDLGDSTTL